MKKKEKLKAIELRKKGISLQQIAKVLGVAKSSVSLWVRGTTLTKKQRLALKNKMHSFDVIEKRRKSRLKNEDTKRNIIMSQAAKNIKTFSRRDLCILGLGLYIGEGSKATKGTAKIANSDPEVIAIMMRYFREICNVPEYKFRCHIHTYSHLNSKKAEDYWSSVTKIPKNQFYKTYVKKSIASKNKKDSTPYGTLDLSVSNAELYLKIIGQINQIKKLAINETI
jgi:predicted transcriptional regulator